MAKAISLKFDSSVKWQSVCKRYTVLLPQSCAQKICDIARQYYPNEIGSSLVGSYSSDGFDAHILDIAPLSSDSSSTRFSFYRGIDNLCLFFATLWRRFSGKRHYIGEWHSHPNGLPRPSVTDEETQMAIAWDAKVKCPESILLVIGLKPPDEFTFGVYVFSRKNGRIDLLPVSKRESGVCE